jgi:hypothetical protein
MAEVELIEVPLNYYSYSLMDHLLKTIIVEFELVVELVHFHTEKLQVAYHALLPYYNPVWVSLDVVKNNKENCWVAYSDKMMEFVAVNEIAEENETFVVVVAAAAVVVVVLMDHRLYLQISFRLDPLKLVYHQHRLTALVLMALNSSESDLVTEIDVVLVIAVDKTFVMDEYSMNSLDIESVLVVVVPSVYPLVLLLVHWDPLIENVNIQVEGYSMYMDRMALVAFVVVSCMDHHHMAFVVVHRPLAFLRQLHVLHIDVAAAAVAVVVVVVVTSIVVIVVEDVSSSSDIHPQLDYLFHHYNMLDVVKMVVGKVN